MVQVRDFLSDQATYRAEGGPTNPLVSVILPTFARCASGQLAKALGSVLAQSFTDFELLVMDDGSRDGSSALIEEFRAQDPRVVHVRHERNSGLPALRANEGIELARGRYVAFQFDDDTWRPQALELLTDEARRYREEAVIVGTSMFHYPTYDEQMPAVDLTHGALFECNRFANNTVLVPRRLLHDFGMYDCHIANRRCCDWDLWLRLIKHVPFQVVTEMVADIYPCQDGSIGETASFDLDLFRYIHAMPRDRWLTPQRWHDFQVDGLQYGPIPLLGDWRRRVLEEHIRPFCTRFGHPRPTAGTGPAPPAAGRRLEVALVHERHEACEYAQVYNYDELAAERHTVKVRFDPLPCRGVGLKNGSDAVMLVRRDSPCDEDTARHARRAGLPLAYFLDDATVRRHNLGREAGDAASTTAAAGCLRNLLSAADAVWVASEAAAVAAHTRNRRTIRHHACVPPEYLPERMPKRDSSRPLRIGLFCGESQWQAYGFLWAALVQVVREFHAAIQFTFWGFDKAKLPSLPEGVETRQQPRGYFQHLRQLRQSAIDILLVPTAADGTSELGPSLDWYHGAAVAGALGIFSDVPAYAHLPTDGTCLKAGNTAVEWRAAIRQAITLAPEQFDRLRSACLAHVRKSFTSTALIDQYEAAWRATEFHALTRARRHRDGRPRIVYFLHSAFLGGADIVNWRRFEIVRQYGIEPILVMPETAADTEEGTQTWRDSVEMGIDTAYLPYRCFEEPLAPTHYRNGGELQAISAFLDKVQPALVHTMTFISSVVQACQKRGIPHVTALYQIRDDLNGQAPVNDLLAMYVRALDLAGARRTQSQADGSAVLDQPTRSESGPVKMICNHPPQALRRLRPRLRYRIFPQRRDWSGLDVLIATHQTPPKGKVRLVIRGANGQILRKADAQLDGARDNDWLTFRFDGIANSHQVEFTIELCLRARRHEARVSLYEGRTITNQPLLKRVQTRFWPAINRSDLSCRLLFAPLK